MAAKTNKRLRKGVNGRETPLSIDAPGVEELPAQRKAFAPVPVRTTEICSRCGRPKAAHEVRLVAVKHGHRRLCDTCISKGLRI